MKLKDLKYKFHEHLDAIYGKEEVQTFFFMLTEYYNAIKRLDLALNTELTIENDCVLKYESALEALKNKRLAITEGGDLVILNESGDQGIDALSDQEREDLQRISRKRRDTP